MSQRARAGFNTPRLPVPAEDEVEGVPEATPCSACSLNCPRRCPDRADPLWSVAAGDALGVTGKVNAASAGSAPPVWFGPPLSPSVARGVFHPASVAASFRFQR